MNRFCIITNSGKDANDKMAEHIVSYLQQKGCECLILENKRWQAGGISHFTNAAQIPQEVECAIVLGGDGTMIQAAVDLVHRDLPIFGVNTGTLGFWRQWSRIGSMIRWIAFLAGNILWRAG